MSTTAIVIFVLAGAAALATFYLGSRERPGKALLAAVISALLGIAGVDVHMKETNPDYVSPLAALSGEDER